MIDNILVKVNQKGTKAQFNFLIHRKKVKKFDQISNKGYCPSFSIQSHNISDMNQSKKSK